MRKSILLLVLVCSYIVTSAQLSETLEIRKIKLSMKIQESNWNMGNIDGFMSSYWKSDSLLFIGGKGPTYGWEQTISNYKKTYPNVEQMGQLTFDIIKVKILNDKNAFVVGSWRLDRKKDVLKGHYTLLWKKIKGEWKIVVDHSS